jgi:hypothetical protein
MQISPHYPASSSISSSRIEYEKRLSEEEKKKKCKSMSSDLYLSLVFGNTEIPKVKILLIWCVEANCIVFVKSL